MNRPITLTVVGLPAPQGSKTRMPNGAMVDGGSSATGRANLRAWRSSVKRAAQDWLATHPQAPLAEPLDLTITFWFPLPKSDPYRTLHATAPDASKLLRSTEDALVHGGLLADDRFVSDAVVRKRYAHGRPVGADIEIRRNGHWEASCRDYLKRAARARKAAAA